MPSNVSLDDKALDAAAKVVRGGFYMLDADVAKNSRRYAGEIIRAYLAALPAPAVADALTGDTQ